MQRSWSGNLADLNTLTASTVAKQGATGVFVTKFRTLTMWWAGMVRRLYWWWYVWGEGGGETICGLCAAPLRRVWRVSDLLVACSLRTQSKRAC